MGLWSLLPIVPPDTKMLIWDFDGTLGYRQGKWSGALVDVLDIAYPDHNFISDHFGLIFSAPGLWCITASR
jgi:hypothetical protein